MKTAPIQQKIVQNFNHLRQIATEPIIRQEYYPTWGLNYHKDKIKGYVCETGLITHNGARIRIEDNGSLNLIKKPLFSTWKGTLKKFSNMLEDIKVNYGNKEVVNKKVLNVLIFSEKQAKILAEAASKIKR